jgi:hypothetical protein
MRRQVISGIRPGFPGLSQSRGQVAHVLLTRSPLEYPRRGLSARLACVKHAASVRPEPGSNSPLRSTNDPPESRPPNHWKTIPTKHQPQQGADALASKDPKPHTLHKEGHMATGRSNLTAGPIKALAFSTLLSSQETDTHRDPTRSRGPDLRGNPSNLPAPSSLSSRSTKIDSTARVRRSRLTSWRAHVTSAVLIRWVLPIGPAAFRRPASCLGLAHPLYNRPRRTRTGFRMSLPGAGRLTASRIPLGVEDFRRTARHRQISPWHPVRPIRPAAPGLLGIGRIGPCALPAFRPRLLIRQ